MKIAAAVEVVAARNLGAIGALARRQVSLASDDRFDPGGGGLLKELDCAEHVAVIGHRESFHAGGFRVFDERADFVGAVEQAVLRVDVKMNETHCAPSPIVRPTSWADPLPRETADSDRLRTDRRGGFPSRPARVANP